MIKGYIGSLIKIGSKGGRGCSGILIEAKDKFIKIQFRDGRTLTLSIDRLDYIVRTRDQNIIGPVVV